MIGGVVRRRSPGDAVVPRRFGDDEGSAVVEFVTLGVLLLVPVVYLVLTVGALQAAGFAAEGAARDAGRVFASADDEATGAAHAQTVVRLAMQDQGLDHVDPSTALSVQCESDPCLTPQARVHVVVRVEVVLPGVPAFLDGVVPARVPVEARSVAVVDRFAG